VFQTERKGIGEYFEKGAHENFIGDNLGGKETDEKSHTASGGEKKRMYIPPLLFVAKNFLSIYPAPQYVIQKKYY